MKRVNERNIKVFAGNGYIVAKGRRYPILKNENEDTYTETDYQMQMEMLQFFINRMDEATDLSQIEYWYIKMMYTMYNLYVMKMIDTKKRYGYIGTCKGRQ
jgi:hypothetical protein